MPSLYLPTDSLGKFVIPGRTEHKLVDADFTTSTIPTSITPDATSGGSIVSTSLATSRGELRMTTAATTNAYTQLTLPQIDLTNVEAVRLSLLGLHMPYSLLRRFFVAIANRADVATPGNNGPGVLGRMFPAGGSADELVMYAFQPRESNPAGQKKRFEIRPTAPNTEPALDLTLLLLTRSLRMYLIEGDQVVHARDVSAAALGSSAATLGVVAPHVRLETTDASARSASVAGLQLSAYVN